MDGRYGLVQNGEIKSYKEYHSERDVNFVLRGTEENIQNLTNCGLETKLKLQARGNMNNMHLFDSQGCIKRYRNAKEIIEEFFEIRLSAYDERKQREEDNMRRELSRLKMEVQLTVDVGTGTINLAGKSKGELIEELKSRGYFGAEVFTRDSVTPGTEYNYLLNKPIWELTHDHYNNMVKKARQIRTAYDASLARSGAELWLDDLNTLKKEVEKDEAFFQNR